jgi:hypothetical protein
MVPRSGRAQVYTGCNFPEPRGIGRERHCTGSLERNVLTCDYNGWADVPEDEREALELLDAGPWISRDIIPLAATPLLPVEVPLTPSDRRAA